MISSLVSGCVPVCSCMSIEAPRVESLLLGTDGQLQDFDGVAGLRSWSLKEMR